MPKQKIILIRRIIKTKLYSAIPKIKIPAGKGRLSILAKKAISFGKKDLAKNFDKYFKEG